MKVQVDAQGTGNRPGMIPMQLIQVIDLTGQPERRALWRSRAAACRDVRLVPGLPDGGRASPMGYWLTSAADPAAFGPDDLRILRRDPADGQATSDDRVALARPGGRPVQNVRVKALNTGDGDLFLTVGPRGAQVVSSEAAWRTLSEPVLLAVCQYWRFCAIDVEIDRLTELAYADVGPATMPSVAALRDRRRLAANAQAVRALVIELPHFEGCLTDSLSYVSSERSAQVYENLVEKLRLEEWCEAIDERAEAIEDMYEAVTEKLFEYRNFAWEALLETVIIVILLGELAVLLREGLAP
jgi:hypothetical protein